MKELIISLKVTPRSSKSEVIKIDESNYRIKVKNPPVEGRANREVVEVLAEYFKVPKNQVQIIRGLTGTYKTVKIII